MNSVVLQDDEHWPVVKVDGTVRRRRSWWTSAVHNLLAYLADAGFAYSPQPIGFDDHNREVLSFIDGESGRDAGKRVSGDRALVNFARLLRDYHDNVRDYVPSPDADWALPAAGSGTVEVVCHGDFAPWNVVWNGDEPVGILDFDLAHPGPAVDDVAYALAYSVPFRDNVDTHRMLGTDVVPNRRRRVELFADAYGTATEGLVDRVVERQTKYARDVESLRQRGLRTRWTTSASIRRNYEIADWVDANRGLFE